jgi:hypothetical protein
VQGEGAVRKRTTIRQGSGHYPVPVSMNVIGDLLRRLGVDQDAAGRLRAVIESD